MVSSGPSSLRNTSRGTVHSDCRGSIRSYRERPCDRQAQAAQAHLDVESGRAQLQSAREDVATSASLAIESDVASPERLAGAERTLAIAERTHEAASARFELGQTTAITPQQAEDDLRRAQLRVLRARVDVVQQGWRWTTSWDDSRARHRIRDRLVDEARRCRFSVISGAPHTRSIDAWRSRVIPRDR